MIHGLKKVQQAGDSVQKFKAWRVFKKLLAKTEGDIQTDSSFCIKV